MADGNGSWFTIECLQGKILWVPYRCVYVADHYCFSARPVSAFQRHHVSPCFPHCMAVEDILWVAQLMTHNESFACQLFHTRLYCILLQHGCSLPFDLCRDCLNISSQLGGGEVNHRLQRGGAISFFSSKDWSFTSLNGFRHYVGFHGPWFH